MVGAGGRARSCPCTRGKGGKRRQRVWLQRQRPLFRRTPSDLDPVSPCPAPLPLRLLAPPRSSPTHALWCSPVGARPSHHTRKARAHRKEKAAAFPHANSFSLFSFSLSKSQGPRHPRARRPRPPGLLLLRRPPPPRPRPLQAAVRLLARQPQTRPGRAVRRAGGRPRRRPSTPLPLSPPRPPPAWRRAPPPPPRLPPAP